MPRSRPPARSTGGVECSTDRRRNQRGDQDSGAHGHGDDDGTVSPTWGEANLEAPPSSVNVTVAGARVLGSTAVPVN